MRQITVGESWNKVLAYKDRDSGRKIGVSTDPSESCATCFLSPTSARRLANGILQMCDEIEKERKNA